MGLAIGDALGPDLLGSTMTAYGFGERPPIDLPDDSVLVSGRRDGNTVLPNDEDGEDAARIAIGQERLTVTPLQMMMVAGAVANRGVLMAPRLMELTADEIIDLGRIVFSPIGPVPEMLDVLLVASRSENVEQRQAAVEAAVSRRASRP